MALLDIQNVQAHQRRARAPRGRRGAAAGDRAAAHLCPARRETFRLGGDAFALLLPGAVKEQWPRLHQLRAALAALPEDTAADVNLGPVGSQPGETFDELLRRADERMYQAKARGVFLDLPPARTTPDD